MNLTKLDYVIYVVIEDYSFLTAKEISLKLKLDKSIVHKSLMRLYHNKYIIRTIDKPYKYQIIKDGE